MLIAHLLVATTGTAGLGERFLYLMELVDINSSTGQPVVEDPFSASPGPA